MGRGVEEIEFVKRCGGGPFDILVIFMPIAWGRSNHVVPFPLTGSVELFVEKN
jgi:hypothetical protein